MKILLNLYILNFVLCLSVYAQDSFNFQIPNAKPLTVENRSTNRRTSMADVIQSGSSLNMTHDVKKMSGKSGYSHIHIVLDGSGSMNPFRDSIVESFETFLNLQDKIEGEVTITIWTFPRPAIRKIVDFQPLKKNRNYLKGFNCSGGTPLYDAMLIAIKDLDNAISKLINRKANPERVIFVVITDGQDNSAGRYKEVAEEVNKHLEEWNFLLLGIGRGLVDFGLNIGLSKTNCFDVSLQDPNEVEIVWRAVDAFVRRSRL